MTTPSRSRTAATDRLSDEVPTLAAVRGPPPPSFVRRGRPVRRRRREGGTGGGSERSAHGPGRATDAVRSMLISGRGSWGRSWMPAHAPPAACDAGRRAIAPRRPARARTGRWRALADVTVRDVRCRPGRLPTGCRPPCRAPRAADSKRAPSTRRRPFFLEPPAQSADASSFSKTCLALPGWLTLAASARLVGLPTLTSATMPMP